MAKKIDRIMVNEAGARFIVAVEADFDTLVNEGRVPHFGAATRTGLRPCDDKGVPTAAWMIVDSLKGLTDVPTAKAAPKAKGKTKVAADPVTYEDGLISFAKSATAEDILAFAETNPTLLVDVIATEKAGKGRVTLIGKLNNLAAKADK